MDSTSAALTAGTMIVVTRPRLVIAGRARRPRFTQRLVARIARLPPIFIVRTPGVSGSAVVTPVAARRRCVRFQMGNRFGGLGGSRFFGTRGRNSFAQLRKDFLQHDRYWNR